MRPVLRLTAPWRRRNALLLKRRLAADTQILLGHYERQRRHARCGHERSGLLARPSFPDRRVLRRVAGIAMVSEDNTLEVGRSRVGLMFDGLPETPLVSVKLERTDRQVEVTIPLKDDVSDIYQHWFSRGTLYVDDPERTKRRYKPPDAISFHDSHGPVGLVGSRVSGSNMNLGTGIGEGRIVFDYTILGASSGSAFESINGLRSEVEGLGTWIGLRSLNAEQKLDEAGRLDSVNLRLQSPPAIPVARKRNAEFQSNWRYGPGPGPDQTTISERMHVHTQMRVAAGWEEHLEVHFPLRDLLRVAAWRRLHFVNHEAMSRADPLRTLDGVEHGDQWLPIITYRTGISTEASAAKLSSLDFLFGFSDVGSIGVGRWINLRHEFERGLTPLVGLLDLEGASLEAHLAQVGIGFETLGYELIIASGISKSQAERKSWEDRVRAVTSVTARVLPFSEDDFVELLRRNYRAVKHADNARTDGQEMYLAYRQAIQVFRAWVAVRLGVPRKQLKVALDRDKMTRHIREIEGAMPRASGQGGEATRQPQS